MPLEGRLVELQHDSTAGFTDPVLRYAGADAGSVVTGLPDGAHYFRIRAVDADGRAGPWSEPFEVSIAYMQREKVVRLLAIGGFIVLATVGAILVGQFRRTEER